MPVYCVQYAISWGPHCVQDGLRALIDRKNSFWGVCFPGFRTPDRRRCLRRKLACRSNPLAMRHLRASWRNIAFNSLTSKIELLCQLVQLTVSAQGFTPPGASPRYVPVSLSAGQGLRRRDPFRSSGCQLNITICDAPGPPLDPKRPVMSWSSFTVPEEIAAIALSKKRRRSTGFSFRCMDIHRLFTLAFQSFSRIEYRFKRPISFAAALGAWTLLVTMSRFSSFLP